jgi:hypothetical protein
MRKIIALALLTFALIAGTAVVVTFHPQRASGVIGSSRSSRLILRSPVSLILPRR